MEQLIFPDAYDNETAHSQVKLSMRQGKHLDVRVKNEEVIVSCQGMARLRYLVNEDSWNWILSYLQTGDYEDFGVFPSDVSMLVNEGYQENKVKELIEQGYLIDRIPFIRETEAYIRLLATFKHGKLLFSVRRTDDFTNYLIDKGI